MSFSIRLGACPRPRPGVFDSCGWQKAYGDWIWFRDLSFDACSSLCYVGLVADHFMLPPVTLVGLTDTDDNVTDAAGVTVKVAVAVPL